MFTWVFRLCRSSKRFDSLARYASWVTGSFLLCSHILTQVSFALPSPNWRLTGPHCRSSSRTSSRRSSRASSACTPYRSSPPFGEAWLSLGYASLLFSCTRASSRRRARPGADPPPNFSVTGNLGVLRPACQLRLESFPVVVETMWSGNRRRVRDHERRPAGESAGNQVRLSWAARQLPELTPASQIGRAHV